MAQEHPCQMPDHMTLLAAAQLEVAPIGAPKALRHAKVRRQARFSSSARVWFREQAPATSLTPPVSSSGWRLSLCTRRSGAATVPESARPTRGEAGDATCVSGAWMRLSGSMAGARTASAPHRAAVPNPTTAAYSVQPMFPFTMCCHSSLPRSGPCSSWSPMCPCTTRFHSSLPRSGPCPSGSAMPK